MKTTKCITVDQDLADTAKGLKINLSGAFNSFLAGVIREHEQDVHGIDIKLETIRRDKIMRQLLEQQQELRVCDARMKTWNDERAKAKENALLKEKAMAESTEKCVICGTKYGEGYERWKKFPAGKICFGCYMSKREVKRWFKDADDPGSEVQ